MAVYEYTASPDDIWPDRLHEIVPLIAALKVTPESFTLRVGDGVIVDSLTVMAYDREGKVLGRLRDFDREVQPKEVLSMRGTGFAQATGAGDGFLELSAPKDDWKRAHPDSAAPMVRVRITVSQ